MHALTRILVALALAALADAYAIKGVAPVRPVDDARSVKQPVAPLKSAAPVAAPVAVSAPAAVVAPAASVPVLESSKKVYNDESIRRLVAGSQPAIATDLKQSEGVAVPLASAGAPLVEPQPAIVAQASAVDASKLNRLPAAVVAPVLVPAPSAQSAVPVPVPAPVAAQAAPVPVQVAAAEPVPVVAAKVEQLPPQSERSAPIKPVEVAAPVKVPEEPVVAAKSSLVDDKPVVQVQAEKVVAPVVAASPVAVPVAVPVVPEQVAVVGKPALDSASLQAKKDEPAVAVPVAVAVPASVPVPVPVQNAEPLHIEVPAPDPGLVLSEPIDSATKLLIDLDEHVQKFLPQEDQQQAAQPPKEPSLVAGVDFSPAGEPSGKSSAPLSPYSSSVSDDAILPPLSVIEGVEKSSASQGAAQAPAGGAQPSAAVAPSSTRQAGNQNQNQQQVITQLMDQLDSLQNRIQDTINQLVARRRYVMSALLRPMGTYVRRVRTNLERLQNRVNQLQAAAVSVGGGQNRPGGFVDAAAIETIRRRIDDISKRISDIVNRIRFSLTPTSAPLSGSNGRRK